MIANVTQKVPGASAWLDFERPVAQVKALFFDVDLAVRGKIHRGIRLQWLPRAPGGERRLRRYLRVLDKMVAEEVVIERGADDTWVERFVEGPNAGTRFVGHFDEQGPTLTRVRLEAWVGPGGFAQGLGKLSPLGLEKAMRRVLGEYKLALQGYEPGHARGAVLTALSSATKWIPAMRALDEARRRQTVSVLLEVAWSIASVDDPPDEAERDAMRAVVAALWHTTIDAAVEERMVRAAVDGVTKHGTQARFTRLGEKLASVGFAELGIEIAVLLAEVSHGLDASELDALRTLTRSAGLPEETLTEAIRRIDLALSDGEPLSRMSTFV